MNAHKLRTLLIGSIASALFLTGCQTPGESGSGADLRSPNALPDSSTYGPGSSKFERDGITYIKGSVAFPSGVVSSSALLLEKVVPAEVMVGDPYQISYTLRNLLDIPLRDVVLTDVIGDNFRLSDAAPAADYFEGGSATWVLGEIAPGGTRNVIIKASSPREGSAGSLSSVTFVPAYSETVQVVRGDIALNIEVLPTATPCDVISGQITLHNTGSARLTNLTLRNALPEGLVSTGNSSGLDVEVGVLLPGESRSFELSLKASAPGRYEIVSEVDSAQGVQAVDSATILVRAPSLLVTSQSPEERFIDQPFTICFKVENTGEATSTSSILTVPVPEGAIFQGATLGGELSNGSITWNLGSIGTGESVEVCATLSGSSVGKLDFTGTARGNCASLASSAFSIRVSGIPAIMLEVFDLKDPIAVGMEQIYQIDVTNQGSAPATNVRVTAQIEDQQAYVSSTGTTQARASGQTIVMKVVPSIAPGETATWQIVVRALAEGDIRFSVQLESDQVGRPVRETEATNQY